VNLGLNLLFAGPLVGLGLGHRGLALATSVTSLVNLAQLAFYLRRRIGGIDGARLLRAAAGILVAGALAAAVVAAGLTRFGDVTTQGVVVRVAVVAVGGIAGLGLLLLALRLLRVEERALLDGLVRSLRARLGR
jgi:putative peptidoglycan lipid II flippase